MKKIILLTKQYPYADREQFLDAELKVFSKYGYRVEIVSLFVDHVLEGVCRKLPENTYQSLTIDTSKQARFSLLDLVNVFFSKVFYQEIKDLRKADNLSKYTFLRALKFWIKVNYIKRKIEKKYIDELKSEEKPIFYSYWLEEGASAVTLLKQKYGCKAVSRVHGYDLYLERHFLNYLPFQKWMISNLAKVYSVSQKGKNYLVERYGNEKIISVSRLGTEDYGVVSVSEDCFKILSCSNLIPLKRVEIIAEAMNMLDDDTIQWFHIGDGPSMRHVEEVLDKSSKTKCELLGRMSHDEIFEFYKEQNINLFVNVSSTEGVPVSIMEAMSFGIPIIATNVGGTSEIVMNNVNGFILTENLTAVNLVDAIKRYRNLSVDDKTTMQKKSRVMWEQICFSERNYREFYKELVGDK